MVVDMHSHIIPKDFLNNYANTIKLVRAEENSCQIEIGSLKVGPIYDNMFEPEKQIDDMNRMHIDKKIASIPPFLFGYEQEDSWSIEWAKCYNDSLAKICGEYPGNFVGLGTVPMQNPRESALELNRCMENLNFAGIEIGTNVNGVDLCDDKFRDFFEVADEWGCYVLVHPNNVVAGERLSAYYLKNIVGNPMETTIAATKLILSGFFKRYRNLKVCLSHGGGTLPYLMGRIYKGSCVRPEIEIDKMEDLLPSNLYYDTVVHDSKTLEYLVSKCGSGQVLLGTDYPFDMEEQIPVELIRMTLNKNIANDILQNNPNKIISR